MTSSTNGKHCRWVCFCSLSSSRRKINSSDGAECDKKMHMLALAFVGTLQLVNLVYE